MRTKFQRNKNHWKTMSSWEEAIKMDLEEEG